MSGTTVERVRIEKLVYGGEGLARMDGQVVLVPLVLPGEEVEIETHRVKNGLLRTVRSKVLEPAADRIAPRCEYFGDCGGCHYQHIAYAAQLQAKEAILRESLSRLGSLQFEGEIKIVSGEPWAYRNRVQLHVSNGRLGFHRAGSHDLQRINHCEISSPLLNNLIHSMAGAVSRAQWPKFLQSFELFTNEQDVQLTVVDSTRPVAARFFEWCATFIPNFAAGAIEYQAAGCNFRISRGTFFQVNRFLVDALVREMLADLEGKQAIDLYAGAGLFTLPLAERFQKVEAVERGGAAYRDLEWNIRDKADRIEIRKAPAEGFLPGVAEPPDVIVADPPRAGLGKDVTRELLRIKAPQIVLVSCDPATLARDLKTLGGSYRVTDLTLVDLFPQTFHFETIARLQLIG